MALMEGRTYDLESWDSSQSGIFVCPEALDNVLTVDHLPAGRGLS